MRFADIEGHGHAREVLRRAALSGRVPHAFLFTGPEGVGKRTMAMAFYSFLVCPDRDEGDSCGLCTACGQVDAGLFVDLGILAPEKGIIKIETVREAFPRLYYEPIVGPWKCLLVDDAHTLRLEAANAALKTLEEPPPATLFILVTSMPDLLPRTVVSRCSPLNFGPVPQEGVARFLARRAGIDEAEARVVAARGGGSPGRALELVESPVLAERRSFLAEFMDLVDAPPSRRLAFCDGLAGDREHSAEYLDMLSTLLSDTLKACSGCDDEMLANSDMAGPITDFSRRIGPDRAIALAQAFLDWDTTRVYTPNLRVAMDRLVLTLNPR